MRILVINAFLPYPVDSGGRRRLFAIYGRIRKSFDITMIFPVFGGGELRDVARLAQIWPNVLLVPFFGIKAPYEGGDLKNRLMRFLHVLNPHSPPWFLKTQYGMAAQIRAMLETGEYDLVHVGLTQMLSYLPRSNLVPSVATEQDVSFVAWERRFRAASGLKDKLTEFLLWQKVKRFEVTHLKRFDKIITVSEEDKENILGVLPSAQVAVVPNGVDTEYFGFREEMGEITGLINVGWFGHYPNLDAARFFVDEVWPVIQKRQPGLSCNFVGKYQEGQVAGLKRPAVNFLGYVEDFRPLLANSLFVVPLRIGGGTRLKILEAMAAGCPVVSTSIGAEGIEAEEGKHLLIAESPAAFADAIQRLVVDRRLRERMRRAARKLVEEKYSWERIVMKQEALYRELVGG